MHLLVKGMVHISKELNPGEFLVPESCAKMRQA